MGASKHFFTDLREGEEYANVSMRMNVFIDFKRQYDDEIDYTLNNIKQVNKAHKENEALSELYKERRKIKQEIEKIEQKLNHHESKNSTGSVG